MKKLKYLVLILIISLLIVFGISYSFRTKVKEYSDNNFKVSYDTTWKVDSKEDGLTLKHKKTDSTLKIQCKELARNYMDTKLSDIIVDIIHSVEIQNSNYVLINNMTISNDKYEAYSYLYEKDKEQVLVNVYKKDNKLIIAFYSSDINYFDIVLDSVEIILDSLEIITGEKIN